MFELVVHPLAHVAGKSLQLELFDHSLGEQGHVMLDHVMLVSCVGCQMEEPSILARTLSAQPTGADSAYLIPASHNDFSLQYLYQGEASALTIRMDAPNLAQDVRSMLAPMTNLSMVKVVEWNTENRWIDDDIKPLAFLLAKYGRFLDSVEYDDFQVHNYVDISLQRPWTFYEQLQPLTVNYDGGIALHGLALGQGAEQLSSQQLLNLGRKPSLWGVLQWQTDPGLDVDYAASLRLYNAEDEVVYQDDDLLWQPMNHWPTSQWSPKEPVDTLFHLDFPVDLPPGDYELRLVVYDFLTQTPTVQQDVWQPEITLARLRLAEAR